MRARTDQMEEYRQNVRSLILAETQGLEAEASELLIQKFCRFSPPYEEEPRIQLIIINSGSLGKSHSRKAGNLQLNWETLIKAISLAASPATALVMAMGALVIWNELWTKTKRLITREQALCLWAM